MSKKRKTILLFVVILVLVMGAIIYSSNKSTTVPGVKTTISRLDDPALVYASRYWAGLCGNGKGEMGGCYNELYLYNTGKFVSASGFISEKTGKKNDSTAEKDFSVAAVDRIVKKIKDSGIMKKDCPDQEIMDAGWDYQITISGVKKSFHNPPSDCRDIFNQIDSFISNVVNPIE